MALSMPYCAEGTITTLSLCSTAVPFSASVPADRQRWMREDVSMRTFICRLTPVDVSVSLQLTRQDKVQLAGVVGVEHPCVKHHGCPDLRGTPISYQKIP